MRHAQTLNETQFRKVLHYCRTRRHVLRDTTIFMVSFFAGLRAKEIAALTLGDVFDADGRVRAEFILEPEQTKGGAATDCVYQQTPGKGIGRVSLK